MDIKQDVMEMVESLVDGIMEGKDGSIEAASHIIAILLSEMLGKMAIANIIIGYFAKRGEKGAEEFLKIIRSSIDDILDDEKLADDQKRVLLKGMILAVIRDLKISSDIRSLDEKLMEFTSSQDSSAIWSSIDKSKLN